MVLMRRARQCEGPHLRPRIFPCRQVVPGQARGRACRLVRPGEVSGGEGGLNEQRSICVAISVRKRTVNGQWGEACMIAPSPGSSSDQAWCRGRSLSRLEIPAAAVMPQPHQLDPSSPPARSSPPFLRCVRQADAACQRRALPALHKYRPLPVRLRVRQRRRLLRGSTGVGGRMGTKAENAWRAAAQFAQQARLAETQSERDFYNKVRDGLIALANEYVLLEAVRGQGRNSSRPSRIRRRGNPGIPGPDRVAGQGRRPRLRAG